MTQEDVDVWESLALRIKDKHGTVAAQRMIIGLMLMQTDRVAHPDKMDAFLMDYMSKPDIDPRLKEHFQGGMNDAMDVDT